MAKAKAKKKDTAKTAAKVEAKKAAPVVDVTPKGSTIITFTARDNSCKNVMEEPVKGNVASEIVFAVRKALGTNLPARVKAIWAPSYKGHYLSLGNKNAVGAFSHNNLLVVNGIADQLEKAGVKGITTPTSKPYKGMMVGKLEPKEKDSLIATIVKVLQAEGVAPAKKAKAKTEEAKPVASAA